MPGWFSPGLGSKQVAVEKQTAEPRELADLELAMLMPSTDYFSSKVHNGKTNRPEKYG